MALAFTVGQTAQGCGIEVSCDQTCDQMTGERGMNRIIARDGFLQAAIARPLDPIR